MVKSNIAAARSNQGTNTHFQIHPAASIISLILTLLVGLSLTLVAYFTFVSEDNERIEAALSSYAQNMSTLMAFSPENPYLEPIASVLTELRERHSRGELLDEALLTSLLWNPPPFGLENSTLEYLPRIESSGSRETYVRIPAIRDEQVLIQQKTPTGFIPASARDEYFPVMAEASYTDNKVPAGLARGLNLNEQLAFETARDTGEITFYSFSPGKEDSTEDMISMYILAIYNPGADTSTILMKRQNHAGYVLSVSYLDHEIAITLIPEEMQGIHTTLMPGSASEEERSYSSAINREIQKGFMHNTDYQIQQQPMNMMLQASPTYITKHATANRWWALSLGILLTLAVSGLILWTRRQSRNIIELVKKRTLDLAERTDALSISEARYRMLADNIQDVIYTYDLDGICTYITPSIVQHTGYSATDYLNHSVFDFMDNESSTRVKLSLQKIKEANSDNELLPQEKYVFEYQLKCKNGNFITTEHTMSFLFDESGHYSGILGAARDITDRKAQEKEKRALEEAYQQSQKMEAIGTLAGGVAHDFNNILTGILGYTDILKLQLELNPDAEKGLNVIENAAIRGKDLTSQLLGFARKGQYQLVTVNINSAISEVIALMERTIDKNIEINTNLCGQKPAVLGDPGQINQLILNLAVNARDAMPTGGKMIFATEVVELDGIFCKTYLDSEAGTYVKITMADSGVGISPEKLERIFEPFFTDKDDGNGTGLGLAMVYGVTKNHGGGITVSSKPGEGATFNIFLPHYEQEEPKELPEIEQTLIEGIGCIMVVDDEQVIREMAEAMLSRLGYQILTAADGEEAVKIYQSQWTKIDLVIMDMIMPRMGGIECINALIEINTDVNIIMSTGYSREAMEGKVQSEHIRGFLQKPFRIQDISEIVASVIH